MKKIAGFVVAGLMLTTGGAANAADLDVAPTTWPFYVSAAVGAAFSDEFYDNVGDGPTPRGFGTGVGGALSGAFGVEFSPNWRAELNALYISNSTNDWVFNGEPKATRGGTVDSLYVFGNVLYDFGLGGAFNPYVGGGLGMAEVSFDDVGPIVGANTWDGTGDWSFAWQVIAGTTIETSTNFEMFMEYRFVNAVDVDVVNSGPGPALASNGDLSNHLIMIGTRLKF